ncbi:putative 6-phosphogluconolactonase 4, chloroplastic [Sesamum angolense]|uniref:6-phosphogluconolactonase 4, chloroplastic n=1 Tax=Sesamum angolense TaxID=2727404 RepID=A0AAE1W1F5_9LAMI|nr:putative 6-phosphogluconolactonase 4, chloroplastic [Sesamum angolense]
MVSKNKQNVIILPTEEDVATALAPYVAGLSEKTISEKGSFSVVLSGGTLIQTLRKLTECPYKETVNWSKWLIFWVDERVVPLNNPDSNYLLALNGFLSKVPIPKKNIYPIHYTPSSEVVAKDYERRLMKLVEHKRYDKTDWVTNIDDSPKPPPKRITFTFPVINSANYIAMVVTDKEEADAVAITLEHIPVRPPLPCSEVKAQEELTWFLDRDAASKLPPQCNK